MFPLHFRIVISSFALCSSFYLFSSLPIYAQSAPQGVTWATRKVSNSHTNKKKSSPTPSKPKKSSQSKKKVATTRYNWNPQPSVQSKSAPSKSSQAKSHPKKKSQSASSHPKQSSVSSKITTMGSSSIPSFSAPSTFTIGQLRLAKTSQVPSGQFADFVVMGNRLYGIERKGSSVYLRNLQTGAKVISKQSSQTLSGLVIEVYANHLAKIGNGKARVDRVGRLTNRQLYSAACYRPR